MGAAASSATALVALSRAVSVPHTSHESDFEASGSDEAAPSTATPSAATGPAHHTRGSWSVEEKAQIVAESNRPGAVQNEVADRHGISGQTLRDRTKRFQTGNRRGHAGANPPRTAFAGCKRGRMAAPDGRSRVHDGRDGAAIERPETELVGGIPLSRRARDWIRVTSSARPAGTRGARPALCAPHARPRPSRRHVPPGPIRRA